MELSIRIPLIISAVMPVTAISISIISLQISSSILEETILNGISDKNESNPEILSSRLNAQLIQLAEIANHPYVRTMDWETMRPHLAPHVSRLNAIEIAMLTPDPADKEKARKMGAADYIKKPCNKSELLDRIKKNQARTSKVR
jgi:hypothetical protein